MATTSVMSVLMFLLSGGGTDLLDYAQSSAYWKSKNVAVSVEQMVSELAVTGAADVDKLIRELGAEDPTARDTATQQLLQVGPDAIGPLRKAAAGKDREIASRATALSSNWPPPAARVRYDD